MSTRRSAEVVIVGAGIAGVATAYELAVGRGLEGVVLVDPRPPLSLTSDKSTEAYRNWWPDPAMVGLMNRSIDRLQELAGSSGGSFGMNRRGYLFVTADEDNLALLVEQAEITSSLGAGPIRFLTRDVTHVDRPSGADVLDREALAAAFPYITRAAVGALHVRRAGWFDAQQLGAWMLAGAIDSGVELARAEATSIEVEGGEVRGVVLDDGSELRCPRVVNAAGPMAGRVGAMAGVDLHLVSELHLKVAFKDHLGGVPREAPMLIWSDPQEIEWTEGERAVLVERGRGELTATLPRFCHGRPEGGLASRWAVGLWEYDRRVMEPSWPVPIDDLYAEVVIRGLSTMVPGLTAYRDGLPETAVDGGYYTKTRENRPLIGPCGPTGFHVVCGLSGFGVMASAGAASLAADHIIGGSVPDYARSFLLSRYEDGEYLASIDAAESGQL